MKGKRTKIEFEKHEMIIIKDEHCVIYNLKKPNTYCDSIRYINCGGVLSVTGDYGNWIFCREFHPAKNEYVSDGYWHEKLKISSTQDGEEFDPEATKKRLKNQLIEYKKSYGKEAKAAVIEYYNECIDRCDGDEFDYTHYAYREYPGELDYEAVVFAKDYKYWLKVVFDGFDEMCRRCSQN